MLTETSRHAESSRSVSPDGENERLRGERRSATIMLVEDEASVRQYTAVALERLGYLVSKAANGRSALEMTADPNEAKIDLLLTDLILPEMDGRELAKAFATRFPKIKVLYLSGYTAAAAIRQGVLEVGSPFLQKPFEILTLAKTVRELLTQV